MRLVTMTGLLVACSRDAPLRTDPEVECVAVDELPYDGVDQDCDGADLVDVDRDGHDGTAVGGPDCDDQDPDLHPGASDVPYDGVDQDCVDGDRIDDDDDGEPALVAGGLDCDDADPDIRPGVDDPTGDAVDADCDGIDGVDADDDGFPSRRSGGTDCDDTDDGVHPDAAEVWYDGVDQDCDRQCDFDQDGDGHVRDGAPVANGSPCDVVPGIEAHAPEDCDDSDPSATDNEVAYGTPWEDEREVPIDAPIAIWLSVPDPAPTVTIADPDGVLIPGTLTVAGAALTFVPEAPFAPGTAYTVEVTHQCGTEDWSFVTAFEAEPIDAATLVGTGWSVDLSGGQVVEPSWIGPFLLFFVSEPLAIEVIGAGPGTLDLRLGDGDGDRQGLCQPTVEIAADWSGNPDLAFGPVTWAYGADQSFDLVDAELSAGVRDGGRLLAQVSLETVLDTRPMVQTLLGFGQPDDAICVWSAGFGEPCEPCADGSGDLCLRIRVEGGLATPLVGGVTPRSQAQIDADPGCP